MDKKKSTNSSSEISREKLYERVWATPINYLAELFGVSGSYLARVCTTLNVPRPPVGYWQKKAVGKAEPRPELPPALPGDQVVWAKDKPLAVPKRLSVASQTSRSLASKVKRSGRHPMLLGVEEHFRKTRKIEEYEFLRPYKQFLPDIVSSEVSLVRIQRDLARRIRLRRSGFASCVGTTSQPRRHPVGRDIDRPVTISAISPVAVLDINLRLSEPHHERLIQEYSNSRGIAPAFSRTEIR